jgi:NADH dehydrogenase
MCPDDSTAQHRVVIIGGGFGGTRAAMHLRHTPVDVVLIDRQNFHLFQPLTYQVATGALPASEVAYPLRSMFRDALNVDVQLGEAVDFELAERRVVVTDVGSPNGATRSLGYDSLIIAAGSTYSYFGHDEFARYALEVKSLESAVAARSKLLLAFEQAEVAAAEGRASDLAFVVVGGGPTGVEMAGQIAELARDTLRHDFRRIRPGSTRVVLVDAGPRLLAGFPPSLSTRAMTSLERLGVTVTLNARVDDVDASGVLVTAADGQQRRFEADAIIWAAGVEASGLAARLAHRAGVKTEVNGQIQVAPDLTLPDHPEVVVIGDMVKVLDQQGHPVSLPGVAPVAIQQGIYAATLIRDRLAGRRTPAFRYRDKGNVATIGRAHAVVDLRVIRLWGLPAWLVWLVVHLWYLIGFRNRVLVTIQWAISFFTGGRGARVIHGSAQKPGLDPSPDGDSPQAK